jgi:LysR family transcriptional regulator, transcriptional activator AphB
MLEALDGARTEVEMQCRLTTTNGLAIKQWAISGVGIARMPMMKVASEIGRGELVHVLPGYTAREFTLFAVYMPERFRPANVRRLLEHAKAYFKGKVTV